MIIEKNSLGKDVFNLNLEVFPSCEAEAGSPRSKWLIKRNFRPTAIAAANVKVTKHLYICGIPHHT